MTEEQKRFIETIAQAAGKYYHTYKILPSLTIAQAILESNWGKSELAQRCHNYFGMKWSSTATCGYKAYPTKEQNCDGSWMTIMAKFREYKSLEDGIKGYYEFLQYKRYQNLKGVTDYKEACRLIKEDGWATALSYTPSLINLIEKYNLTSYDGPTGVGATATPPTTSISAASVQPEYKTGQIYTLQSEMKVRTGAGIEFRAKAYQELTENGKQHDQNKNGCLDKGTKVTCKEIKKAGQDIWMRTPSGWIAAFYQGKIYIQ